MSSTPDRPTDRELDLRALRLVETRLDNLLGAISTQDAMSLLAMELAEADDDLNLVAALAAVGAVAIILLSQEQRIEPDLVIAQIRSVMTPS